MVISGPAYIPTQISENGPPQLIVETIGINNLILIIL